MDVTDKSESGAPIYRHTEDSLGKFKPAIGDGGTIEAISSHIERNIGPIESVFHELVSDQVHLDIYWVKPSDKFPFHVLVTSGMSDKPMSVPANLDAPKYLELCVLLPAEWKIDGKNDEKARNTFSDENVYWPIRWLKNVARFPHTFNTWVGWGHTIPNGPNAAPFAESTKLGCIMLIPSITLPKEFFELKIHADKTIYFLAMNPLYKEEMDFKLKNGVDKLLDKFDEFGIADIISPSRRNVCQRSGLFGLW